MLQCYSVTVLQCYSVTVLQCYSVTVLQCECQGEFLFLRNFSHPVMENLNLSVYLIGLQCSF